MHRGTRVLGIDPGSSSWDCVVLEAETSHILSEISFETQQIKQSPQILLDYIEQQSPLDFIVAPSGFGMPLTRVQDLTTADFFAITLRIPDTTPTMGLEKILEMLKVSSWNAWIIPGVKHLPTVKTFHKINRVDLGTADKVCTAVVAIKADMKLHHKPCTACNFLLLELGHAFTSILAIENGQIIDGIGGSNLVGMQACGGMDAELIPLLQSHTKKVIYSGGITTIHQKSQFIPDSDPISFGNAYYLDALVKGLFGMASVFQNEPPTTIYIARGAGDQISFLSKLAKRLKLIAPIHDLSPTATTVKSAALGAAYLAEGLIKGPSQSIIENMQISAATGHVLDYVYLPLLPTLPIPNNRKL